MCVFRTTQRWALEVEFPEFDILIVSANMKISDYRKNISIRLGLSYWQQLDFRHSNTVAIGPSKNSCTGLFRTGSYILRPERSCLTADNFEKLVFIKGHLHLLEEKRISDGEGG